MPFWDQIKDIFQSAESGTPADPTIHEVIERTEEEIAAYEH